MGAVEDRIDVIIDLLLGAAYADEQLRGSEEESVRKLLAGLLGAGELPAAVEDRIAAFTPEGFDLAATAEDFAADPPINKRKLLELVAAVTDADGESAFAEDDYLRRLGLAVGLEPEEFADLTLDYEVEELRPNLAALRSPPPIPKD